MKIKIIKCIRASIPIPEMYFKMIELGVYEAKFNQNGAASVMSKDGKNVGVKPDEFEFLNESDRMEWIKIMLPYLPAISNGVSQIYNSEKEGE